MLGKMQGCHSLNISACLPPGAHEIKIIVKDRQQNQAIAVIPFRKLAPMRQGLPP